MGVNKVQLKTGETIMDVSGNTVNEDVLFAGYTATNAQGEQIKGRAVPGGGSGGSGGIIDVTELPTTNIDVNAVYRVTESFQTNINEAYCVDYVGTVRTAKQLLENMGVPTTPSYYIVDELPSDMKASDVNAFTELNAYILKTDGKVYFYVNSLGIITMGILVFQDTAYDKGSTDDVSAETEMGIYTTFEAYEQIERWYIRENGAWKEVSSTAIAVKQNGALDVIDLSGEYQGTNVSVTQHGKVDIKKYLTESRQLPFTVLVDTPCTADILGDPYNIPEIPIDYFRKKDGTYVDRIRDGAFMSFTGLRNIVIPDTVQDIRQYAFFCCSYLADIKLPTELHSIEGYAFYGCMSFTDFVIPKNVNIIQRYAFGSCSNLNSVTFKGKPSSLFFDVFIGCDNLKTINVPWAEGEVADAPWSAFNATINYNYTED